MTKMHCPECRKEYQDDDLVFMNDMNTVRHVQCGDKWSVHKDTGTFKEIIYKYDFFEMLREKV